MFCCGCRRDVGSVFNGGQHRLCWRGLCHGAGAARLQGACSFCSIALAVWGRCGCRFALASLVAKMKADAVTNMQVTVAASSPGWVQLSVSAPASAVDLAGNALAASALSATIAFGVSTLCPIRSYG